MGPQKVALSASFSVFIVDNSISIPKQLCTIGQVNKTAHAINFINREAKLAMMHLSYTLKNTKDNEI